MKPTEVKTIRKGAGLTIRRLAAVLRINDEKTIRRWENGDVPISGPASIIMEMIHNGEFPARYLPEDAAAPQAQPLAFRAPSLSKAVPQ